MFNRRWTEQAAHDYAAIRAAALPRKSARNTSGKKKSTRAQGLLKQVAKTVQLLAADPRHPDLRTHEYTSLKHPFDRDAKVFEAYAQNNTPSAYRVFWCYGPGQKQITIIAITPHP